MAFMHTPHYITTCICMLITTKYCLESMLFWQIFLSIPPFDILYKSSITTYKGICLLVLMLYSFPVQLLD